MAKPKLGLIPAAQGSKFYSVLPSSGVGDFNFTRSGSATRINSQGLIETVGNGVSRLNYPLIDGKVVGCPSHLLEPQTTQLVPYSESFTSGFWTNASIGTAPTLESGYLAPDGTNNAFKISNPNKDTFWYYSSIVLNTSARSIYARTVSGTGTAQLLTHSSNTNNLFTITEQWQRFDVNTANGTGASNFYAIDFRGSGTLDEIIIWGANGTDDQNYPTSYIPTNGTTVTRNAETCNGAGTSATFNDSEGVLMAEISALANDGTFRFISLKNNTTVDIIRIGYITTPNRIEIQNYKSGALFNSFNYEVQDLKTNTKVAFKWKDNDFQLYINGLNLLSNTSVTGWGSGVFQSLQFDQHNGGNDFYGNTKQIQYYDSALTDSELETLTSWVSFSDMANGQQYIIE